jgi:hypothetical protein
MRKSFFESLFIHGRLSRHHGSMNLAEMSYMDRL